MAVGLSGVAELNSYFANLYEDAVFAVHEQTIATRLVRNFTNGNGDQTRTFTAYPTISPATFSGVASVKLKGWPMASSRG